MAVMGIPWPGLIELNPTPFIGTIGGIECRMWVGRDVSGNLVHAFIAAVGVEDGNPAESFFRKMQRRIDRYTGPDFSGITVDFGSINPNPSEIKRDGKAEPPRKGTETRSEADPAGDGG